MDSRPEFYFDRADRTSQGYSAIFSKLAAERDEAPPNVVADDLSLLYCQVCQSQVALPFTTQLLHPALPRSRSIGSNRSLRQLGLKCSSFTTSKKRGSIEIAIKLYYARDCPCPAGLVTGSQSSSIVAVEVLVE